MAEVERFTDAIRQVGTGGTVLDPEVVKHMLGRRDDGDPLDALTDREREVLAMDGRGQDQPGDKPAKRTELCLPPGARRPGTC